MNKTLIDLPEFVKEISAVYGERDAYRYIVDDNVVCKTFRDLERHVNSVASWFVKKGYA